jgi:EVE domain
MTSHHIGVVHSTHVGRGKAAGFVAFSHGRESVVRSLEPGDRVIFYAPKTDFDGDPVQAFVGHATVTGDAPYLTDYMGGFQAWVRDAVYDDVTPVPVRPLIDALTFIRDKTHWGMAFRQGKFRISDADYALIARHLLGAA